MFRSTAILLGLACWAACCPADEKKVPLETEIPREILAGTPPNMLVKLFPNLEMPPDKAPELLVPEGTKNVALKKKITASDNEPILGKLEFITDGVKEGTEESYVELAPGSQWIQIDLEKPTKIYALYLWHFFREARSYHDVIIQVADDAEFTKNVQTIFNNDTDASSKQGIGKERPYIETNKGRMIDAKGVTGQHVRLYSKGNTANSMNHYVEVEVFGKPAS